MVAQGLVAHPKLEAKVLEKQESEKREATKKHTNS